VDTINIYSSQTNGGKKMSLDENMQAPISAVKADYKVYLTDVFGTTTPQSELEENSVPYVIRKQDIHKEIADKLGVNSEEIPQIMRMGLELGAKGDKQHPVFKQYLQAWDIGAGIGYQKREIVSSVEPDVKGALEKIVSSGAQVVIFASGAPDTTRYAMESNGLAELIKEYYSSSQKNIGSKFEPEAYREIARQCGVDAVHMVYVTDTPKEAIAAVDAGYGKVFLIDRKKTAEELGQKDGYEIINDYAKVAELVK
jgi:methionine salvage enolase-phosphatase E1